MKPAKSVNAVGVWRTPPARSVPPTQQLDDIPWSRVREALKVLLDLDDLTKLMDVVITPDAITATAVALDGNGQSWAPPGGKPATHRITRRIVLTS